MVLEYLFIVPALIVALTNIVIAVAGLKKQDIKLGKETPFVSVLCSAWNEEFVIERKIQNYLHLDILKISMRLL